MSPELSPAEFAAKWAGNTRTERAASQEHFIDLCRMLGEPTPNEADPTGDGTPSRRAPRRLRGGDGFADVWKRGHFAWEYKGKHKDLKAAYSQLLQYREALENPPLLVVCDLDRFEVHTNFTNTPDGRPRVRPRTISLADPAEPLRLLRAVMQRSGGAPARHDTRRADRGGGRASSPRWPSALRGRGHDPQDVAHFLDKLLFCLFAEDAGLLPAGLLGGWPTPARQRPRPCSPAAFASCSRKMADERRAVRRRAHRVVQRRPLRQRRRAAADRRGDRARRARLAGSTGRRSSRPSSARSSSAASTPSKRTQLGAHYTDRAVDHAARRAGAHDAAAPRLRGDEGDRSRPLLAEGKTVTARTPAAEEPARGLQRLPRPAARRPRARPRLRLGQLPLPRPAGAQGPGARGHSLGVADACDVPHAVPAGRPTGGARHRAQPLRRRARPRRHLDRRDPVDAAPTASPTRATRSSSRSRTSSSATPSST